MVHPSRGHLGGTLVNALAHHFSQLSGVGGLCRPGIVHRLDRDTSGLVIVAKNDESHMLLAAQWEARTIEKHYFALVAGVPDRDRDQIEQPIGMHPHQREKMAIRPGHPTSREATTFYEVCERYAGYAAMHLHPRTGRTHQIRVHLAHIGCPVLCDRLYGGRAQLTLGDLQQSDDTTIVLDSAGVACVAIAVQAPSHGSRSRARGAASGRPVVGARRLAALVSPPRAMSRAGGGIAAGGQTRRIALRAEHVLDQIHRADGLHRHEHLAGGEAGG